MLDERRWGKWNSAPTGFLPSASTSVSHFPLRLQKESAHILTISFLEGEGPPVLTLTRPPSGPSLPQRPPAGEGTLHTPGDRSLAGPRERRIVSVDRQLSFEERIWSDGGGC